MAVEPITDSTLNADGEKWCAGVRKSSYSSYKSGVNHQGLPADYSLDEILIDKQANINTIAKLCNYFYGKYGLLMTYFNMVRDLGWSGFKIMTPHPRVRKILDNYNDKVDMEAFIKDVLFEKGLYSNVVIYDKNDTLEIYPIFTVEATGRKINNHPLMYFNLNNIDKLEGLSFEELCQVYPVEVAKGIKEGADKVLLDPENTYFLKSNCSRWEKYGVPILVGIFEDLAFKSLLREGEKSALDKIINSILHVQVGDKDHTKVGEKKLTDADDLFRTHKGEGSSIVTTPYWVNAKFLSTDTDIFDPKKYAEVNTSIMRGLGISVEAFGEGGGNYASALVRMNTFLKRIETDRQDIIQVIKDLYSKELIKHGINPKGKFEIQFDKTSLLDEMSYKEFVKSLFQLGVVSHHTLLAESGFSYEQERQLKLDEKENGDVEVFWLPAQPFQGDSPDNGGEDNGRPKDSQKKHHDDNSNRPKPSKDL